MQLDLGEAIGDVGGEPLGGDEPGLERHPSLGELLALRGWAGMVRMLEKGPLVNRIRKLSIRSLEERDPDSKDNRVQIPFNMELWTYFSNFDSLPTQPVNLKDVELAGANSPFNPLVRRNLPPNTQNLLEVERANLQAIVAGRALVADAVGKIHEVSAGSEVYLGYVTEINPEQGFVEFTINKGGLVEKVRLSLKFNR